MRIAIVGATGRTGRHVVRLALDRGDSVVAIARHPEPMGDEADLITVVAADVLDAQALSAAVVGCDAVVSTVGVGTSRAPTTVYSQGVTVVLEAMSAQRIRRLSVVSAAPVGPRDEQPWLERCLVMPVLDRFFGATYADMARMETVLGDSALDWTCLRPPRLVDRPATGHYRVSTAAPLSHARTLTFADLAQALLDGLDRADLHRRPAYVAN